ncbi:hypothetical protein M2T78_07545 [Elizabethkingia ursingii]|uniref:hypothetical protein n=1 Tax=Elizabethkingia ursingii TaxID=1756150 RepID=UPI0020133177|nr:hypothetical protein [Elizabethkingia ursingii]MCL1664102.1 hypothetical protein [Elizabethkingia ursingii]
MKNNFIKPPLLVVLLLLFLYACRSEDGYLQQVSKEDMRFSTFVSKDGKSADYANGFEHLMKKYDTIHKTNKSGINNRTTIGNLSASIKNYAQAYQSVGNYVEFRVRSQVIKGDEGQIIMLFPRVENNNVKGIVMAFLVDNGTKLGYVDLDEKLDLYKDNISAFKEGYIRFQKRLEAVKFNPTASISTKLNLLAVDYRNPDGRCDPSKGNPDLDDIQYCKIKEIAEVIMTKYNFVPFTYTPTIRDNMGPYEREQFELYMKLTGQCSSFVDCLGGGGPSTPSEKKPLTADKWATEEVDDRDLQVNDCANNVYKKLKSKPGLFNNLMEKFDGKSILNLRLRLIGTSVPAETDITQVKNGFVSINFNTNYLGSSELGRASLFIHEMLHAYMTWQLVNSGWDGINDAESYKIINEKKLPSLLKAYKEKNYERPGESEHEFIANYYIPKIVTALKSYDPNLGTDSEYEAMAWNGLEGTKTFGDMLITDETRAKTISSIISDNIKNKKCGEQ